MTQRAKKRDPNSRCCWVCGKQGGMGFTAALRVAGYDVPRDEIGYAHAKCMQKALAATSPESDSPSPSPCTGDIDN